MTENSNTTETTNSPVTATEAEVASLIKKLEESGLRTTSGRAGNSPYSAETIVAHPATLAAGDRVSRRDLARSHNGADRYKGRGRWRTVVLLTTDDNGPLAVCDAGDRGAEEVGHSGLYVRPWATEEAEQATGGLGTLADLFAGLDLSPAKPAPLVVTRHPGLVTVLLEDGVVPEGTEVVAHATPEQVRGKHVYGVLPLHLAAEAASVTEVTLDLPAELRGQELSAEQVRQYRTGTTTYQVTREEP
jgi:CRISPR-associated protein Csx16